MNKHFKYTAAALSMLLATAAFAKASPAEVARLGKDLTCAGAEKAGNKEGVAEFTGKWLGAPPGFSTTEPLKNPYANEKPLYTVTGENMAKYAQFLSPGLQTMLKKYPSYALPVYQSHRDFRYADWVCDRALENAKIAELTDGGQGIVGVRGSLAYFPFPKTGLELAANLTYAFRPSEAAFYDVAVVYPGNRIAWGRQNYRIFNQNSDPSLKPTTTVGTVYANANVTTLLPLRDAGTNFVTTDSFNTKSMPRVTFGYDPGTRRVRQYPAFGFDSPDPATSGFRTIDEDRLFNGSPERYDWKILGKQSMIIPYNAYGLDDTRVKYQDLLGIHHINPAHTRYEMHRLWVVEATLKPTYRHKYAKRIIFVDEDTWQPILEDNYDSRGQLWRVNQVHLKYIYGTEGFQTRVTTYNDILRDAYVIDRMTNEAQQQPRYGKAAGLDASMFTPDYSRRMGR
ncbi:MAG: DUF1329 domain-containing protein [Brachymonas sp.]|jgi:hypothetical protein